MKARNVALVLGLIIVAVIVIAAGAIGFTHGDTFLRAESAKLPDAASIGPAPTIPQPANAPMATVKIAPAKGWSNGETPVAAPGLEVKALATGLDHPRWVYVLPNGDVLVAEAATEPQSAGTLRGYVQSWVQRRSGAIVENANRISLLRDANGEIGRAHV